MNQVSARLRKNKLHAWDIAIANDKFSDKVILHQTGQAFPDHIFKESQDEQN